MTGPAWLVLPTFNEAENLETVVAAARRVLGEARARGLPHPRRRRRLARRHRRHRRRAGRGAPRRGRGAAPARARGPGPGLPGRLRAGARGRRGLRVRDGRRPLARPGGPRAPARAPCATAAPTSRWARATWPAAASPTGAPSGASSAAAARGTRAAPSGLQVRDLTGGFKCFRAEVLRADRPAERALARLRLPGRADLPRASCAGFAWSRCRSSSATASWGRRRCRGGSPREAAWLVPQLRRGAAHLRHPAGSPQAAPSSRRIDTG